MDGLNSLIGQKGETSVEIMKTRLFCQALIEQNVTQPSQVSSLVHSYFGEGEYLPLNVVEDELKAMVNQVLRCYKEFLIRSIWSVCLRVEEIVSCVRMICNNSKNRHIFIWNS